MDKELFHKLFNSKPRVVEDILSDISAKITYNRFNLLHISRILLEYKKSLELVIFDYKYRKKNNTSLILPIDFSEIYSYMYKSQKNVAYGKLVEFFLENNQAVKHNRYFTLLPGTILETIFHLVKIFDDVRAVAGNFSYDDLLRRSNVRDFLSVYNKERNRLIENKIRFKFSPLVELQLSALKIGLGKENYPPIKNFMKLINTNKKNPKNSLICPIEETGVKPINNKEKYENQHNEILSRLNKKRAPRLYLYENFPEVTNNDIDAMNLIQTLSLNDTFADNNDYFALITRDLPADIFNQIVWYQDPVFKKHSFLAKDYKPISRFTQYAYYSVLADNLETGDNFYNDIESMLINFESSLKSLIKIFEKKATSEFNRNPSDYSFQSSHIAKQNIKNILSNYLGIEISHDSQDIDISNNKDIDEYLLFGEYLLDKKKFNATLNDAQHEISSWAKELKAFLEGQLKSYQDNLLENCIQLLEQYE